jgi:hypothetical protein
MFLDPCIIVQFIEKNPTRCNIVSKFIITYLYEAQHVSGDTTHHQEPKTVLAASGFAYVEGCQAEPDSVQQLHGQLPFTVLCKSRGC